MRPATVAAADGFVRCENMLKNGTPVFAISFSIWFDGGVASRAERYAEKHSETVKTNPIEMQHGITKGLIPNMVYAFIV